MAVDDSGVVDIISIDPHGNVVLTVSDHLDWTDSISHQQTLQVKLNRYLAFVESGEILEQYPKAIGKSVIIEVVTQHDPGASGMEFLDRAAEIIANAGFTFRHSNFRP